MNYTVVVDIRIVGHVSSAQGWRPRIEMLHVAERFDPNPAASDRRAILEFTPVVGVVDDPKYFGTAEPFAVDVKYPLNTWKWGRNELVLSCAGVRRNLALEQRK